MDDIKCVAAVFGHYTTAKKFVNDLLERDMDQVNISLVFGDEFKLRGYASTFGPLKGITTDNLLHKFIHLGFGNSRAQDFKSYLNEGYSIVAVSAEEEEVDDIVAEINQFGADDVEVSE